MIKSESKKRYPFRVIDEYGESMGDFHTLDAARIWIKKMDKLNLDAESDLEYFSVYQCIEDHNQPEEEEE